MTQEEFSLIGRLLHDIRKEKKLSMEDVCHGLCNKATLSRIERGEIECDIMLAEALFTRMGVTPNDKLIPVNREQYQRFKIREQIDLLVDISDSRRKVLLEEYKNGKPLNKFEKQFYAKSEGIYKIYIDGLSENIISIYEKALQLTLPNFKARSLQMPEGLLSYFELALMNNMAHAEFYMSEQKEEWKFLRQIAIKRIQFLKSYYEKNVDEFKKERLYSIIIFNLTNWTEDEGDSFSALEIAKKGLECEKKSIWYYSAHGLNIGVNLAKLGNLKDGERIIGNALNIQKYTSREDVYKYLVNEVNKNFGFHF